MTSFYMFRLWYMTFAGEARDHHRYDHAHESPWTMAGPLVLLAVFAVCVGWTFPQWSPGVLSRLGIENLLDTARPVGQLGNKPGALLTSIVIPDEHAAHLPAVKIPAGISAILVAIAGIAGATVVYLWEMISPATMRRYLNVLYHATWNKWWFDELYDYVFVRPTMMISRFVAFWLDRGLIDSILHGFAYLYRGLAVVVAVVGDKFFIDKTVDTVAEKTWNLGLSLRSLQTGQLRQYVMFIVVCTIALFIIASLWQLAIAG
jgi:NADH-quinone oxidoreductase subunit L